VEALGSQPNEAVVVLELLSDAHEEWGSKFKRRLKDLSEATTPRIEEAALVALARDGDRGARKQLLEPLDDRVDENESLPSAWEARGSMRYKIGDYKNAIKDYTEALKLSESYGRPQPDLYVGLARAHAQLGKEKDAAEWLDKAPISISELRQLAKDPVFASLVENDKYREVFHLKED
jgi:tetratricopeptide (TPR) repeat protein